MYTTLERDRNLENLQVFVAEVLSVDIDRKICSLKSVKTGVPYQNVRLMPANHSSSNGTDMNMPEVGTFCLAVPIVSTAGFQEIAILNYVATDTLRAQQGIAVREIDIPTMQGYNLRTRGTHRKAYQGQKTVTNSHGYSERQDDGWERTAADMTQDILDPDTRTWTQTTSRRVEYSDGHTVFEGPVNRPGASGLGSEVLPDGTTRNVVYLQPGATATDRYVSNKPDVIPFTEITEKVQEFAADFAIPAELIGSSLLNQVLGVTADPWARTTVSTVYNTSIDSQAYTIDQVADHPYSSTIKAVGSTTGDGPTPQRRGYIIERSAGTLIGSNLYDTTTYGKVLKPTLFPYTTQGRFAVDVESAYLPVVDSADHAEARLAASAYSMRFTHEANTTRWDVTKEGFTSFEIGSTLPKENIPLAGGYEHPHGAGRSLEGHLVGSMSLVVGKNRDEEESIDITGLGQAVIRLGADDTSLPNTRRSVMTQNRGQSDAVTTRSLQYWAAPKLSPGDAGSLTAKTGGENISLRAAMDGGTVIRFGARNINSKRRHLMNGYQDGPGKQVWSVSDPNRMDSKTSGRPTYGAGDSVYRFHDLTQVGKSQLSNPQLPYAWSGAPVSNVDGSGLSLDAHLVQDALLRIGQNPASGQSLLMDLAGGIVAALGKDNAGRSITAQLDGGVEMTIGMNSQGKALRIEFNGDIDWTVKGNFHLNVTGDTVFESTTHQHITKTDHTVKGQRISNFAMVRIMNEAPDIVNNQGLYVSDPNA